MQKLTFYTQYILKGKYIYVLPCILFQSHEKFTFWRQLVFNKQQHAMKYVTHWIPNTLSLFIKMTHEKMCFYSTIQLLYILLYTSAYLMCMNLWICYSGPTSCSQQVSLCICQIPHTYFSNMEALKRVLCEAGEEKPELL